MPKNTTGAILREAFPEMSHSQVRTVMDGAVVVATPCVLDFLRRQPGATIHDCIRHLQEAQSPEISKVKRLDGSERVLWSIAGGAIGLLAHAGLSTKRDGDSRENWHFLPDSCESLTNLVRAVERETVSSSVPILATANPGLSDQTWRRTAAAKARVAPIEPFLLPVWPPVCRTRVQFGRSAPDSIRSAPAFGRLLAA
ncbi:MAG: hypothetical protein V3T83_17940 [Acidobacteriota bacterium]